MKRLVIGNEAIARGAYEAGVRVATAYPGTPSTEIIENLAKCEDVYAEWAPNEKVAFEVASGASIAGARTIVAMKHVGVNVAADPLYTMAYIGVNAGLVVVSADDPGMHSSQNEQDNRGYGIFAKIPVIEPSDSQEALEFTKIAFDISEQFDAPVMLRTTTRLAHSQTMVEFGERQEVPLKDYVKNAAKNVMLPAFARARHIEVEKKMLELQKYGITTPLNRIEWGDKSLGIITSGMAYQYVKEALPNASILKLGLVNPLSEQLIRNFAEQVDRLVIVEELEPVIEKQVKAWGIKAEGKELFTLIGEYSAELIEERLGGKPMPEGFGLGNEVPPRPPLLCPGCPHRGVFLTLRKLKLIVTGDIGCYTLGAAPPLEGIDTCICMGASIGASLGMEKARGKEFAKKTIAIIGDSTFIHSGITGLIDMVYNQGHGTVIILDNDITAMTGHQDNPATGITVHKEPTTRLDLVAVVKAVGIKNVVEVDPLNLEEMEKVVKQEVERDEPSVIIARRPCALLKPDQYKDTLYVDPELCKGCKQCIKVGCTGVHFIDDEKRAEITSGCVGCGVCVQVCRFDAIKKVEG